MKGFLNKAQETQILEAIREAERTTSGEVRVHIDGYRGKDVMKVAAKTFHRLRMDRTELRNGVLIFIAPKARHFAILGDQGIDEAVGTEFWEAERDILQDHFRRGDFANGISTVVRQVGEKLKAHFPYQSDDVNELPDDISYS